MRQFRDFFKTSVGTKPQGECAPCEKMADEIVVNQGHAQSGGVISGMKNAFGGAPKPAPPPPPPTPAPTGSLGSRIADRLKAFSGR